MALVWKDRVKETSTTTGTGTYTLAGATAGFQAFSAIGNANTCYYVASDGTDWEVGVGTYTLSGTTLARTSVLASSNGGSAVSWAAGTRNIWVDYPAAVAAMLAVASGKVLTVSNSLTLAGTDGRTMTFPSTNATIARTDAGQTFSGNQVFAALVDISGASAGQIAFPASQNATSGATTLDDYEEGTFTPTWSATGCTFSYNQQQGTYVKVGSEVSLQVYLALNTSGNTLAANNLSIAGFPFSTGFNRAYSPIAWEKSTTSYVSMACFNLGFVTGTTAAATTVNTILTASTALHATNGSIMTMTASFPVAF